MAEGSLNPRDVKMRMAREIVSVFHDAAEAHKAEEAFIRQFSERELPADIPGFQLNGPVDVITLMVGARLAKSRTEARKLVEQGGVSFFPEGYSGNAQRVSDAGFIVPARDGAILKVGKLKYIRIKQ
jgi:tyrosyl-tRNA synthetase